MKEIPKHFSLIKEHPDHFLLHDSRDNKAFPVAKKGIHPATQMHMLRLPKFAEGGSMTDPGQDVGETPDDPAPQMPPPGQSQNWSDQPGAEQDPQFSQTLKSQPVTDFQPDQQPVTPQPQDQTPAPQPQGHGSQNVDLAAGIPKGYPTLENFNSAMGMEAKGINMQAQGQMQQNHAVADAYKQSLALEAERNTKYQENMQRYQVQNDQLMKDVMDKKINPEQYWENHSRVGAALAVLVSGIGAGLQHSTQNMALGVIQNGIDKSIESQKAELGKKENLLSNNLRIQGNLMQAETATRLQTNAMLQGKLAQIAAESGDPILQGKAMQTIGQLRQAGLPQQMQLAQYQANMHMRQQILGGGVSPAMDPSQLVQYVVPEHHQAKALEEIKNAQDTKALAPKILAAFDRGSSRNPNVAAQGQREFEGLINTTVKDLEGSARQAAFDSIHNTMTPSGLTAFHGEDDAKRRTVIEYLASKASAPTAKGYGIDLNKFNSTRMLEPQNPNEGKTGTIKGTGQRVMMKNGQLVPIGR